MDNIKGAPAPHKGHAAGSTDIEKAASQLVSDVKYKVNKELSGATHMNPAQIAAKYLQKLNQSAKAGTSPTVIALARKKLSAKTVKEEVMRSIDPQEMATNTIANAFYKVFVENKEGNIEEFKESYSKVNQKGERLYHIIVKDKKTGNTYTRDATREKIAELRANPNIASVEMSERRLDSEKEKTKGANTAAVKAGKGLKNDGNLANNYPPYDKVTRGDVIAGATGKDQMGGKRKVKEEFIGEVKQDPEDKKKITGKGVNNYKSKSVKVFPEVSEQMKPGEQEPVQQKTQTKGQDIKDRQTSQALDRTRQQEVQILQRKLQALRSAPKGTDPSIMASYEPDGDDIQEVAPPGMESTVKKMKKHPELTRGKTKEGKQKNVYALAWYMYNKKKGVKEEVEGEMDKEPELKKSEGGIEDPREIPTKVNLVKNKFRAMGLKMSYEPEGEIIDERRRVDKGKPRGPEPSAAFKAVSAAMGSGRMGVQPRGQTRLQRQELERTTDPETGKKVRKRSANAGPTPAQRVALSRAQAERSQEMQQDTRRT